MLVFAMPRGAFAVHWHWPRIPLQGESADLAGSFLAEREALLPAGLNAEERALLTKLLGINSSSSGRP